jgi:hypothetical protein
MTDTFERLKQEAAEMGRRNQVPGFDDLLTWGQTLVPANDWRDRPAKTSKGVPFTHPYKVFDDLQILWDRINYHYPYEVEARALAMRLWWIHPLQDGNSRVAKLFYEWAREYLGVK